jgi:tRNA U38,U39,U40 pseudouridine synthase TruA
LGRHDFSSFRASECQAKSPMKTVDKIEIIKHEELIEKDFQANFDRYFKISKLFTFEISLAFEAMRRKMQLYQDYKGW